MASNSILKLQVDDKQYEASLKSAQQGLQALMNALRNSGKSFSDLDKNTEQYVRALGNMEATAKNTRGRIGEMSSAFVELSQVEKQLTDQERQSPVGKALTESLNQLKQRTIEAKQELADLDKQLTSQKAPATTGGMFSGLGSKMEGALAVFGGNMMTAAAGAVANLGAEMADMVKQGVEMAKAGEGVRIAFERLGNGRILDGLREATHGTVTDLELMKAAVKFNDFKLPLDELGTMLAFAQQKAKDTGQSVDYMVDSIVTGLGRKSLMILDNLGLSASEIREKMKETGDMTKAVGEIIRSQMASAGEYVETAADRAAQANVSLQNKMEELGRKFAPLQEASNTFWTSVKTSILDIVGGPMADFLNNLTEAGRRMSMLNNMKGGGEGGTPSKIERQLSALRGSNHKEQKYQSQVNQYDHDIKVAEYYKQKYQNAGWAGGSVLSDVTRRFGVNAVSGEDIDNIINSLRAMRSEYIKSAKDIIKPVEVNVNTDKAEQNVASLKKKLKELEAERKKAVKAGDQELVDTLSKQINETKTNLGYLDPNAVKTGGKKTVSYADDSIMAQEKLISDLTQKWKTASGELRDGYLKDLEDAQKKLAEMTGKAKLKTDGAPTFTAAQLEGMSFDNQMPTTRGNRGRAQDKLDLATAAFATSGTSNVEFSNYISGIKNALSNANLGDELYNNMTEKLKDATTVSTLLQEMMERGLAGADLESTAQALKEKLLSPEGIDQTTIQSFLDELNKQIEEAGGVGLKLNPETGEVTDDKDNGKNDGEELKKFNEGIGKLTGGLSQVTGGLKAVGVEIPKEVDQVLGVINGVSQIISGVGTIISVLSTSAMTANTAALGANTFAIGALITAIELNTATNIFPFANGGIVPAFAHGGLIGRAAGGLMIPGNSMSGDRLRLPVDGGLGMIGVNSGELILNRAQQGNLASQLEGGVAAGTNTQPFINGEQIYLGLQAYMRRSGLGEIVTAER